MLASINKVRPGRTKIRDYDLLLLTAVGALLITSIIMVYSASIATADQPDGSPFARYSYVIRQGIFVLVGLAGAWFVSHVRLENWEKAAPYLFIICIVLLILVRIPHIGRQINGAYRWIPLPFFNLQPSECMKFAIILYTADYVTRKNKDGMLTSFVNGLLPIFVALGLVCALIVLEPDLGAVAVIGTTCFAILYLGGIQKKIVFFLISLSASFMVVMISLTPWRLKRFLSYRDPFSEEYAQGIGYQLVHSLIAIGRGGWNGQGLGFSIEKMHYLPEAHTDFIMAVIGEELGFVGMIAIILCYMIVVWKGFRIGRHAMIIERYFSGYVAQGVAVWIGVQALINLGVCLGMLPTKGLTLPLISYGGSAMVMNLAMIALLIRVDYENRQLSRGRAENRRTTHESASRADYKRFSHD